MRTALTASRLRELLAYDPETGVFTWRVTASRRAPAGTVAGGIAGTGRIVIGVDGVVYQAHRLAWLHMTGDWPTGEIDHRDTDPTNNRWRNLRDVTRSVNQQNQRTARKDSRSGLIGVTEIAGRFRARIKVGGRDRYLGYYDTAAQAHAVYVDAKRLLHPGNTL